MRKHSGFLVGEDGFAFLRKSHGSADMPLACLLGRPFRIRPPSTHTTKNHYPLDSGFLWWGRTDSNHRSETQQIYSLSPLATRELPLMKLAVPEPVWSR